MKKGVVEEWMEKRDKHPFFGEGLSKKRISEIWDQSAENYDDKLLGDIQNMVIESMRFQAF